MKHIYLFSNKTHWVIFGNYRKYLIYLWKNLRNVSDIFVSSFGKSLENL